MAGSFQGEKALESGRKRDGKPRFVKGFGPQDGHPAARLSASAKRRYSLPHERTAKPQGGVLIADSASLAALCSRLGTEPYITIDTEFLRDKTFWPQLCLVQLASPHEAAAVDTLVEGLDSGPCWSS